MMEELKINTNFTAKHKLKDAIPKGTTKLRIKLNTEHILKRQLLLHFLHNIISCWTNRNI
jgi:hypothetical protein